MASQATNKWRELLDILVFVLFFLWNDTNENNSVIKKSPLNALYVHVLQPQMCKACFRWVSLNFLLSAMVSIDRKPLWHLIVSDVGRTSSLVTKLNATFTSLLYLLMLAWVHMVDKIGISGWTGYVRVGRQEQADLVNIMKNLVMGVHSHLEFSIKKLFRMRKTFDFVCVWF